MDDAELGGLEHANFIAGIALVAANLPNGIVRREDGVALLASGVPMRLFNQVLVEDDRATADGVADAVARMRSGGYRYLVHLRDGADDRFLPLTVQLGLVEPEGSHPMPGMTLFPIPDRAAPPPELEIRRVVDAAGLEDHIAVAAEGFGLDVGLVRSFLDPGLLAAPGTAFYVGYVDGSPVVSGLGIRTGRTIGVYNIGTVEAARRRGYGAAMTERVGLDGRAAGCDVAALQASDMGRPIYERLGYRTVVEYRAFIDP